MKGWYVCVLTPDASRIISELPDLTVEQLQHVLILDPQTILPLSPGMQHLVKNKLFLSFWRYLLRSAASHSGTPKNTLSRIHKAICRRLLSRLSPLLKPSFTVSAHSPEDFATDIKLLKHSMTAQPTLVLNMYLDIYSNSQSAWRSFYQKLNWQWVGIHIDLKNTLQSIQKDMLRGLRCIFFINEDINPSCLQQSGNVDHHWLPDVASTALPDQPSSLALKTTDLAKGRRMIFLGGAIGGTKNIAAWCAVIRLLDPKQFFFIQAGAVDRTTLSKNDLSSLQDIESNPPENLLIFDQYLKNDCEFNELISISDLIWGVYRDFDRSSNILGKAAMFHKPILVSDKFLMGHRVKEYGIGLAVDENNTQQIAESIAFLISHPIKSKNFDRYSLEHGPKALSEKLDRYLTKYCQTQKLD